MLAVTCQCLAQGVPRARLTLPPQHPLKHIKLSRSSFFSYFTFLSHIPYSSLVPVRDQPPDHVTFQPEKDQPLAEQNSLGARPTSSVLRFTSKAHRDVSFVSPFFPFPSRS